MRLIHILGTKMDIIGRDNGNVMTIGKIEQHFLDAALVRQSVTLQLDIEPVTENIT